MNGQVMGSQRTTESTTSSDRGVVARRQGWLEYVLNALGETPDMTRVGSFVERNRLCWLGRSSPSRGTEPDEDDGIWNNVAVVVTRNLVKTMHRGRERTVDRKDISNMFPKSKATELIILM